jgi:hypothetical protein
MEIVRSKVSFDTVRKLGLQFPHVEEGTAYGQPALKVKGAAKAKAFACMSSHKSAEPGSLVIRVDLEQRAELLAADPNVYYITDHYKDYPAVLVRLGRVTPGVLKDVLGMAYRFVLRESAKGSVRKRAKRPTR